ncbi:hypothetical protein Psi02_69930 [Planotetraspora silvatica]|uniref:Uncharacterized protein n=1 Tax=Planotetraspora silvatica TaxID=234614 RepID=A0A8J3XRQ9_9ACTN|nr:hypothetical protein Psi02_69930 [Planotetraspora silvatica]
MRRRPGVLRLGQDGQDEPVVVGRHPGELTMPVTQCEAQPAQVGLPGLEDGVAGMIYARSYDPEHFPALPVLIIPVSLAL